MIRRLLHPQEEGIHTPIIFTVPEQIHVRKVAQAVIVLKRAGRIAARPRVVGTER